MMEQAQAFLDESEALFELIKDLDDEALELQTGFKGWTINAVIGHLHMWNHAADLSLEGEGKFEELFSAFVEHMAAGGSFNSFELEWRDGLNGQALVTEWQAYYRALAHRFGAADPKARVEWAGPGMSVRSSVTARLMETWAHGQEIYDLLGVKRQNRDYIKNIVVLGLNTYGFCFQNRKMEIPEPRPFLKLTAPSGVIWEMGEANDKEVIEGLAEEFCQVVTQTRSIADTTLQVTGENATAWMDIAQCFAGAPQDPPLPGTRKTETRH
ncbi:MAG: TIGR03084 family metal-binding protein [Alphaproteobacteria bacterium]